MAMFSKFQGQVGFIVSHLVIPEQTGTPNSFEAYREEDVVAFQSKAQLIKLGWIHTHPSQTAFLSSVDLHTHFWHQKEVPEAVAIVCAPLYNEAKIFHIDPEGGMDILERCSSPELFHIHHERRDPLFKEATHTVIDPLQTVTTVDLRRI